MGIVVDLIIIAIIALSAFLGYRKGLVVLAIKLCAFIIAIAITFVIYKPVANVIINVTGIDETIENAILEKANGIMSEENNETSIQMIEDAKTGLLPEAAREIAVNIVTGGVFLILFIIVRIAIKFVTALANAVAKLPIIKQFNEIGGLLYGLLRGLLIIYVAMLIIGVAGQINPENTVHQSLNSSYIGKMMYNNNILNVFF